VETCHSRNISAAVAVVTKNGSTTIAHITKAAAIEMPPQFLALDATASLC